MVDSTIIKLQSEIAKLRAEKERIDASINEIDSALKVFAKYSSDEEKTPIAAQTSLRRTISKREQIFNGVMEILSDGKTRHTDEVLKELAARGVEVGGDKPEANLSAYLSRAKTELGLDADRRYGWSLKK